MDLNQGKIMTRPHNGVVLCKMACSDFSVSLFSKATSYQAVDPDGADICLMTRWTGKKTKQPRKLIKISKVR